jgi:hypothetical protein
MLEHAKKINSTGIRNNQVEILLGRVEQIPYRDGIIDKILAINVIYLWPDLLHHQPGRGCFHIKRFCKYQD